MNDITRMDWSSLGEPKMYSWLLEARSNDRNVRLAALGHIKEVIAPWELLDGYGSSKDLQRLSESLVPEAVIPFLIDLFPLQDETGKTFMLEIFYDLARYKYVNLDFIPSDKKNTYFMWTDKIRDKLYIYISFFNSLLTDVSFNIQQNAQALINILT